jgi:phage FluMu gp28-like protein
MITTKWYAETFPKLKERMEEGQTNIPDDYFIREDFRVIGLKAGVPCIVARTKFTVSFAMLYSIRNAKRCDRHGDGAVAKVMAVYACSQDEEKGYQPMTYEAIKTENRFRASGINAGGADAQSKDKWHE